MYPVRVLLDGLTADGQVYAAGTVVPEPGPQLAALAPAGVLHGSGLKAAEWIGPEEPPPTAPAQPVPHIRVVEKGRRFRRSTPQPAESFADQPARGTRRAA